MKKNINRNEMKSQKWFVFRRVNMVSKCLKYTQNYFNAR